MKKQLLVVLFVAVIAFGGNLFSFTPVASAHNTCTGLSTLTDPLAIRMEKGERLIWDNVHPELVAAKDKYVTAINNKGWKITFSSAYRPEQYQKHLKDIFTLYNKKNPSSCIVAAQKEHGIQGQVATTSNHTKGLAFDATIKDKNGKVLNANGKVSSDLLKVANSVGLTIPVGVRSNDAVHHELLKSPSSSSASTTPVVTTGYPKQAKISNVSTSLNVRSAANNTSSVIGSLKNNAAVTLTAISGDYYRISLNGKVGWVSKSYVTIVAATVSEYPKTGYVNTTSTALNVRKTASATATVIGSVKKGAEITVTGKSNDFYSIKINNTTGWVSANYITFTKPVDTTTATVSEYPKTGYVNTTSTSLNVRKSASATAGILGTVAKGKALTVTGKSGNFYSIKVSETAIGWVAAEYVTFTKPVETTTAVVSEYPKTGYVNTTSTSLNVRKSASATAAILGTVAKGKALTVTGKSGNFYSIKVSETAIGWVAAEYVTFTQPTASTTTTVSEYPKTGYINTQTTGLNFRTAADGNSAVIALLTKGTAVNITGKTGNWYQAVVGGKTGYLSADYISFTKPTTTTTTNTNISAALSASKGNKATDSTFTAFLPTLANIEGGFSNHPLDSGGKTNYGITEATYKVYYPGKSIYNITYAEAVDIYKRGYWNPISPSILSERLAIVLFDSFVNHGSGSATKMLQIHLGIQADGIYGSGTKNKVMSLTVQQQDELALKYLQQRKNYRSNIAEFQKGWAARDLKIYNYIKNL